MTKRATPALGTVLLALLGFVALLSGGVAYVRAAADVTGYVGKGQLVVQTAFGGADTKLTVGGNIALETRGSDIRVDVLSLGIPGADATLSSILTTQLFPPGGFTIVYDRQAATLTVWSTAKHNYYTNAAATTGRAALPSPTPASAAGGVGSAVGAAGNLLNVFAIAKSLKNQSAFTASLSLAGHGTVNGHPATGLDYQYAQTAKTGEKTDVHGRLQLADDLDAVPVQIAASMKSKNVPESSLRLDLTTLTKQTPPESDFAVPQGYTQAADLGEVIGKILPR